MRLLRFCQVTFILGTIIIWGIKWGIRPYFHCGPALTFFWGIAPNLLGSFLLPFGGYWFFKEAYRLVFSHSVQDVLCTILLSAGL